MERAVMLQDLKLDRLEKVIGDTHKVIDKLNCKIME